MSGQSKKNRTRERVNTHQATEKPARTEMKDIERAESQIVSVEQNRDESYLRKNSVALAALVVALTVGTCNYLNNERQFKINTQQYEINKNNEERWYALNQPRIDITPRDFARFAELTETEIKQKDWARGYVPYTHPVFKDRVLTDRYALLSQVVFWDPTKNSFIPRSKPIQTNAEVAAEAQRLGIQNQNWDLKRQYIVNLLVRNSSQSTANNIQIKYTVEELDLPPEIIHGIPKDFEGNKELFFSCEINWPLGQELPPKVHYRFWLQYDFEGKQIVKEKRLTYDSVYNRWEFQ